MSSARLRAKDPDKAREYAHSYYMRNREKFAQAQKERRKRLGSVLKERQRWYGMKHVHGITKEQFDAMLVAQNGVCGLCGGPPRGRHNQWHIDHDHTTDVIRGLLCMTCNPAIERADSSEGWLERAAEWVKRGKV